MGGDEGHQTHPLPRAGGPWLALQDNMDLFGITADAVVPHVTVSCSPESCWALFFHGIMRLEDLIVHDLYKMAGCHCSGQDGMAQAGWSVESKFMVSSASLGEMQIFLHSCVSLFQFCPEWKKFL